MDEVTVVAEARRPARLGSRRLLGRGPHVALAVCLALFLAAIVYKAWICDDAYITLRTADNWARGHGPTWNPGERVQAYTHPLWLFVVSAAQRLTGDFSYTTIFLGLLLSLGTVVLFALRVAPTLASACLGLAILTNSRAFTDFATSGLENPLTHLIVTLFACVYLSRGPITPRKLGLLGALLGLALMNRVDAGIALLPAVVVLVIQSPWSIRSWLPGLLPFVLWEAFSLVYYGSLIPNSAYAKLNSGLGMGDLAPRGLHYLLNSLTSDPVTFGAIVVGIVLPFLRRSPRAAMLSAGAVAYLVYVVCVGGDFMSGRFLTTPLLLATIVLAHVSPQPRAWSWPAVAIVMSLMLIPRFSAFTPRHYGPHWDDAIDNSGVSDERSFYIQGASLITSRNLHPWPQPTIAGDASYLKRVDNWRREPFLNTLHRVALLDPSWPPANAAPPGGTPYGAVVIFGAVGCMGYYLGPSVHVIDYHAIGDPMLARLPAVIPDPLLRLLMPRVGRAGWRAGHYPRRIPEGYPETLSTGVNRLQDPDLARFYDRLDLVTHGSLFDPSRIRVIWELNTGKYAPLIQGYLRRHPEASQGTPPQERPVIER